MLSTARLKEQRISHLSMCMLLIIWFPAPCAETADENRLDSYLGKPADELIADLGEPKLMTPQKLWYFHQNTPYGGRPGAPQSIVGADGRVGAASTFEPPGFSREFCEILVQLAADQTIANIDVVGPGCFRYLHQLRQEHADSGRSTP